MFECAAMGFILPVCDRGELSAGEEAMKAFQGFETMRVVVVGERMRIVWQNFGLKKRKCSHFSQCVARVRRNLQQLD